MIHPARPTLAEVPLADLFFGPGRRGVSARVPSLRRRHPAHCLYHGAGADPEDPHASWRTARTAANRSRAGPSDRLGRTRAGPRRPRRLSSLARQPARDRHPQPLTGAGHEASTQPPRGPTRRDSAHKPENRHFGGGGQADWEAPGAGRDTGAPDSRAAHQSGDACGSAISRAILQDEHGDMCARAARRWPVRRSRPPPRACRRRSVARAFSRRAWRSDVIGWCRRRPGIPAQASTSGETVSWVRDRGMRRPAAQAMIFRTTRAPVTYPWPFSASP